MKPLSLVKYAMCVAIGIGMLGLTANVSVAQSQYGKSCDSEGIPKIIERCASDLGFLTPEECDAQCSASCEWPEEYACTSRAYDGSVAEFSVTFDQGDLENPHLNIAMKFNDVDCVVPISLTENYVTVEALAPVGEGDDKEQSELMVFITEGLLNCANVIIGKDLEAIAEVIELLPVGATFGDFMTEAGVTEGDITGTLTLAGLIGSALPCLVNDGLEKAVLWAEGAPVTYDVFWDLIKATVIVQEPEPSP
jgi:hypothetical protein